MNIQNEVSENLIFLRATGKVRCHRTHDEEITQQF